MPRSRSLAAGDGSKTKQELIAELQSLRRRVRGLEVAEDALRESEARLKAILDNAPATIYLKDLAGRFIVVNRHFEERFQVSADQARGANAHDMGPKPLADAIVAQEAEALQTRAPVDFEETWETPEGDRTYGVIKFPVVDSAGAIIAMGGIETDISERKAAEKALRESEEHLRLIADTLPAAIIYVDADWRYRFVNKTYCARHGVNPDQVLGKRVEEFVDRATYEVFRPHIEAALAGRQVNFEAERTYRKAGRLCIQSVYVPHIREDGTVQGIYVLSLDITERKRAEEARRKSEARLKAIMDNAPVEIMLKDRERRYLWVNRAFETHFGKANDEVRGKTLEEAFPEADYTEVVVAGTAQERAVIASGEPNQDEYQIPGPDGLHPLIMTKFPIKDESGEVVGLGSISIDITKRKRAEEALRTREAQLAAIMDNAPVEILLKDRERRYLWVNRQYEMFFGRANHEVRGKTLSQVFPEARYAESVAGSDAQERAVIASGEATEQEDLVPGPDGLHTLIAVKFPIKNAAGEIQGLGSIATDISERKRMEEALRAAKEEAERANRAKSRFLAAASHDLRQPLHALGLFASALAAKVRGKETRLLVERIQASLEALDRMFGTLLDISRLEAGAVKPDVVDLPVAGLLERMTAEFAPQAGEKGIDFHAVSCAATVRSDPALLERILRNLIVNAVRCTDRGRVLLGCRRRNSSLRIEVWDTGWGIPEDQIGEAFGEFQRLGGRTGGNDDGLGLGLTIVERMSRLLGHRIHVVSAPGKGSMFAVEAPLVHTGAGARGPRERPARGANQVARATVLVIDDEANVLEGTRAMLESWGCRVLAAGSADEALIGLATLDAAPDLIVADYHLGGALNGIQTIRLLRDELGSDIPGLVMTGDTAPERVREVIAAGHRLFHKPCSPERLRTVLAEILDPNRAAAP
jgi:PAS domain S-box-containing protein